MFVSTQNQRATTYNVFGIIEGSIEPGTYNATYLVCIILSIICRCTCVGGNEQNYNALLIRSLRVAWQPQGCLGVRGS